VLDIVNGSSPDDDLRLPLEDRLDELGDVFGAILIIGVDIDYYVCSERLPNLIKALKTMGDKIVLTRKEKTFITIETATSRIPIDFYLYFLEDKFQSRLIYAHDERNWSVGGAEINWNMAMYVQNKMRFWVPNNPQHCLQCWYGPNWRTPVNKKEFYGIEKKD